MVLITKLLLLLATALPVQAQSESPPPGRYRCFSGLNLAGEFNLLPNGRYTVGDLSGMAHYDPNERLIKWKGGYFDGSPPAEYLGRNSSGYTLRVPRLISFGGNVVRRMWVCHNHPSGQ